MSDKPNPAHAGMVKCVVKTPLGEAGRQVLMHPMDALEYHNLGLVEADKGFLADLEKLDAAKRKQRDEADAQADASKPKTEE